MQMQSDIIFLGSMKPLITTVKVPHLLKSDTLAITTKSAILKMPWRKEIYRNNPPPLKEKKKVPKRR